mgnify:CR=1 FL=1
MLTPRFKLEQDDKYVIVKIYAPFTNISETEVFMDAQDFRFFSKPYFLRLHFSGQIEENEEASAAFDAESLSFIVKCPKVCQGEFFSNLDMISELCNPPGGQNVTLIEDLDDEELEDYHDWYFEQNVVEESEDDLEVFSECCGIGFGLTYKNVFERLLAECQEILDVKNPGQLSLKQRFEQKLALEGEHFDSDHYLCDLLEPDDTLKEALDYDFDLSKCSQLSDEDRVKLVEMGKVKVKNDLKDTKSSSSSEKEECTKKSNCNNGIHGSKLKFRTLCAINELIFAYCYDLRTNLGEHCSESAWTIAKLCPSLTCSTMAKDCRSSIIGSLRRSLIYPIVRHYGLSTSVHNDTVNVWRHGKVSVIKILLDIIKLFQESEGRYIFNQLYLQHYVTWIQSVKSEKIAAFAQDLSSLKLNKEDLGLDLTELESAAILVQQEHQEEEEVIQGIENLCANESDSDDDSDASETSDSSDSDESTTESSDNENKVNDDDA